MILRSIAAALLACMCSAAAAGAQAAPGPAGTAGQENARRKVEEIKVARLTRALRLDEKTAPAFVPQVIELDNRRRALMAERRQYLFDLRRQLEARDPDPGKLSTLLEKLRKNEHDLATTRDKDHEAARNNLTIEQHARYVIFQMDFNREVRGIIDDMRGPGGPGGRGHRSGRGPGALPDRP